MFEVYCRKFDQWFSVSSRAGKRCSWCGNCLTDHPTEKELIDAYYETRELTNGLN